MLEHGSHSICVQGLEGYAQYFAMARGAEGADGAITALDMSKNMDSNYHILVPELNNDLKPSANWQYLLEKVPS